MEMHIDSKMSELTFSVSQRPKSVFQFVQKSYRGPFNPDGVLLYTQLLPYQRKGKRRKEVKDKMMIFFFLLRCERERTVMASGKRGRNNLSESSLKSQGLRKRLTMNSDTKARHDDS